MDFRFLLHFVLKSGSSRAQVDQKLMFWTIFLQTKPLIHLVCLYFIPRWEWKTGNWNTDKHLSYHSPK